MKLLKSKSFQGIFTIEKHYCKCSLFNNFIYQNIVNIKIMHIYMDIYIETNVR